MVRSLRPTILQFSSSLMPMIPSIIIKLRIILWLLITMSLQEVIGLKISTIIMSSFYLLVSVLTFKEILLHVIVTILSYHVMFAVLSSYGYVDGVFFIIIEVLVVKIASIITGFFEHMLIIYVVHFFMEIFIGLFC